MTIDQMSDLIILQGIGGSQAYGTARPDSDTDRIGVYVAPIREVLGFDNHAKSHHFTDPEDFHLHEIEKFLTLALKGNPTITELLWLADYEVATEIGHELLDNRLKLMGASPLRRAYVGYAKQQLKRNARVIPRDAYGDQKRLKALKHCYRLLLQAQSFVATGALTVRLTASERTRIDQFGELSPAMLDEEFNYLANRIDLENSPIPEHPNYKWAEDFLIKIRMQQVLAV